MSTTSTELPLIARDEEGRPIRVKVDFPCPCCEGTNTVALVPIELHHPWMGTCRECWPIQRCPQHPEVEFHQRRPCDICHPGCALDGCGRTRRPTGSGSTGLDSRNPAGNRAGGATSGVLARLRTPRTGATSEELAAVFSVPDNSSTRCPDEDPGDPFSIPRKATGR